jgi:geranylgeranyl pyrophosphate synthase
MCVALAGAPARGFDRRARDLAVAAELVHNATLLHDDVVDLGDLRRGAPAARVVYGNAASIFAGDWLLVEAIARIRAAGFPDLLDRALDVLRQMLSAEACSSRCAAPSRPTVAYLERGRGQDRVALPLGDVRRGPRGRAPRGPVRGARGLRRASSAWPSR